jgi:Transcriptional regulator/sugar kinase
MYNLEKKHLMRKIILNIIRNNGPISRTSIKKIIDFRMATIIDVARELLNEGIILESGDLDIENLKKKKLLCLNENFYYALGIDIQADCIIALLTNLNGKIIKKMQEPIKPGYSKTEILEKIFFVLQNLSDGIESTKILGIGVSNSGILNKEKDNIIFSSQLENWKDVPIKRLIREKYQVPVFVDDSAVLNLMAERWFGNTCGPEDMIFVQLGASFGVSIISNGNFIRGASGVSGEIGHMMVEPKGSLCICGNYGCLQTVASSVVIIKKITELLKRGAYSIINEMAGDDLQDLDIHTVIKAAEKNDKIALSIIEEAARYIGIALSNTINLINPKMIIFGGQMVKSSDFILEPIKRIISTNALQLASKDIVYKSAAFNEDGGALGAATMVLDEFFEYTRLKSMGVFGDSADSGLWLDSRDRV